MTDKLPKGLISTAKLAEVMGGDWDAERVRELLKRTGAGFKLRNATGTRSAWFTTRSKIREMSPELFDELVDVEF